MVLYGNPTLGVFFSASFPRIFDPPPWDQYKSGKEVDQYLGGYAFYKHPKLLKKSCFIDREARDM